MKGVYMKRKRLQMFDEHQKSPEPKLYRKPEDIKIEDSDEEIRLYAESLAVKTRFKKLIF